MATAARVRSELYDDSPTYCARPDRTVLVTAVLENLEHPAIEDVDAGKFVLDAHPLKQH